MFNLSVLSTLSAWQCAIEVLRRSAVTLSVFAAVLAVSATQNVQALTLTSDELIASTELGCVLADDALGYLSERQFNERFDETVDDFSEEQIDVIYAKALGYIDGLLYGVPTGDSQEASRRLLEFSSSQGCTNSYEFTSTSLSI